MKQRIVLLILCLGLASLACNFITQRSFLPTTTPPDLPVAPISQAPVFKPEGMSMGDPEAKVKVEEFSDFQCPYCKNFFTDVEPGLISKYVATGKVLFVYNPFSFIGSESLAAAEAGYCAADQNKFWELHGLIFAAQGAENSGALSRANLKILAKQAGLDTAKFNTCLDKGAYAAKVEQANKAAAERGVQSTPSFFVNEKGPFNSNELIAEIEKALKGQ